MKTENVSFPYKTAIPEANVNANRMVSIKWTYHKEQSFASNYFRVDLMYQHPNAHIRNICKRWSFI